MATLATYPHLQVDAAGVVRVGASRYKVAHLAGEHYHYGWSAEELLRQHPGLRSEEVYAALAYFYDNYEKMAEQLNQPSSFAEVLRKTSPFSREEILRRKSEQE